MRLHAAKSVHALASLLSLSTLLLPTAAIPLDQETELIDTTDLQNSTLARRCENPCGWAGQLCCSVGLTCYTDANSQAQCGGGGGGYAATTTSAAAAGGYWQYYTSTWVETNTVTKTAVYSTYVPAVVTVAASLTYAPAATGTGAPLTCNWVNGETACGNICCASTQYCLVAGQCAVSGYTTKSVTASVVVIKTSLLSSYSVPLRPTASTVVVVGASTVVVVGGTTRTTQVAATTTVPFLAPVATGANVTLTTTQADNSGGLSGGAIAGIVIGVIAGIILLLLLCLFFCFRELWHALLDIFGFRDSRRETVEIEEYRRHGGGGGGRRWPGDRPSRPSGRSNNDDRLKEWGGVAAILAAIAVALGFSRSKKREEKSEYSSDSYDSYYTDSESSDRRTRDTRRSSRR